MNTNPLAEVIRTAFINNVTIPSEANPQLSEPSSVKEAALRNKRITLFTKEIENFLKSSGAAPLPETPYINEHNLLTFSLQLSGYIRDAQEALSVLTLKQAHDPNLIRLYSAAAKYSVDYTKSAKDCKYKFEEHQDYCFWKVQNPTSINEAKFNNYGFVVNPTRKNIFLSMPFHIKQTQEDLQKWTSKFMQSSLDDKRVFNSDIDVYLAHFPIEQPRGEKFALSLTTIQNPETYFTETDMKFVQKNFSCFLGKDIKYDDQNRIISGKPFTSEEFKENCNNITIVSYCAGTLHAHRWVNALSTLASQIYDEKTTKDALKNIFVISYASLPIQNETKYSGVHFMSNFADDNGRKEPFIKMFNPELYEKCKYLPSESPARISIMPDGRNCIVALKLPEQFQGIDMNGNKGSLPDIENGHHMALATMPNADIFNNHAFTIYQTVLKNAAQGKRGNEVFKQAPHKDQRNIIFMSTTRRSQIAM